MEPKRLKRFLATFMTIAMMLCMFAPTKSYAEDDSTSTADNTGVVEESGLYTKKTATIQSDGSYEINIEAYAEGKVVTTVTNVPTDIVLVLDVSGSMEYNLSSYSALESQSYSYNSYGRNEYYYLDADGQYHRVFRGSEEIGRSRNKQTIYYLYYYNYNSGRYYYLSGTTTTTSQPTNVGNNQTAIWSGVLYELKTETKMEALRNAVNSFIDAIAAKNAALGEDEPKHRVSIVKFAGTEIETVGNDTYDSGRYNYNYTQIVKSLTVVDSKTATELKEAVSQLEAKGATSADYGLNRAEAAFATVEKRLGSEQIVVMFTDGEPTYNNSGFGDESGVNAINKAKTMKENGVKIFTIGVLDGASPGDDPTASGTSNVNKYMHAVSSNYPNASATGDWKYNYWGDQYYSMSMSLGERADNTTGGNSYYKAATSAEELNNIFQQISDTVANPSIQLSAEAVLKDIVADQFVISGDNPIESITVAVEEYAGNNNWNELTADGPVTDTGNGQMTVSYGNGKYNLTYEVVDGSTINIKGFDYSANFVHEAEGSLAASGAKLVVTIKQIFPTEAAFDMGTITTNDPDSGIYQDDTSDEPIIRFSQPEIYLSQWTKVFEEGKPEVIAELAGNQVPTSILTQVEAIPEDSQHLVNGVFELNGKYGYLTYYENATEEYTNPRSVVYTPTTMNWDGYDSFYGFQYNYEDKAVYHWMRFTAIPADSVYYEDTFVTVEDTDAADHVDKSVVGIVFGDMSNQTGTAEGVWETVTGDNYGDESAHMVHGKAATATFTFSGTGVDVYSRTDLTTGMVLAQLTNAETGTIVKQYYMNNTAQSGEYYQIPTVTFGGGVDDADKLPYGTYTLKITVYPQNGTTEDKLNTFYLDGVRVYNPLSEETEQNSAVHNAYDGVPSRLNAVFTEVRDVLIDSKSLDGGTEAEGVVFVDHKSYSDTDSANVSEVGEYEDYGPKNEVYLQPGQSIGFKVDLADPDDSSIKYDYTIGLKAPTGTTTASVTNGDGSVWDIPEDTITAKDAYYTVTPTSDGTIVITNTGNSLLSVTKIRRTSYKESGSLKFYAMNISALLSYIDEFDTLEHVLYAGTTVTEEEIAEEASEGTTEEVTEEVVEVELNETEVTIENPEPEKVEEETVEEEKVEPVVSNTNKGFGWLFREIIRRLRGGR